MTVDAFVSQSHYLDHIVGVWRALGAARGHLWHTSNVAGRVAALGLDPGPDHGRADTILTASWADARTARRWKRVALMEHGVGQSYVEAHDAYAGGFGRCDFIDLFLCPNDRVAAANRAACPAAQVEVVGSPYLDGLARLERAPTVDAAVSFHWDCDLNPETGSTVDYWWPAVLEQRGRVLGHRHPKDQRAPARFHDAGIGYDERFEAVVRHARVFVADNTSCLFYAAALGLGVVVLDHPRYRRHVEHGLRFWDCADVGVRCGDPGDLQGAIDRALTGPTERAAGVVGDLFPWRGVAVERAVGVLTGHAPHTT